MKTTWTETSEAEPKKGERIAFVRICHSCFGKAVKRRRTFAFRYSAKKRFHVDPPERKHLYITLWHAIGAMPIDAATPKDGLTLTPEEETFLPKLPNGWSVERYSHYWKVHENVRRDLYRLNWLTAVTASELARDAMLVHPAENRCLTTTELHMLQDESFLVKWLDAQAKACDDDEWGDDDWESSYNGKAEAWIGRDTPNFPIKWFDLTDLAGYSFDLSEYSPTLLYPHPERKRV